MPASSTTGAPSRGSSSSDSPASCTCASAGPVCDNRRAKAPPPSVSKTQSKKESDRLPHSAVAPPELPRPCNTAIVLASCARQSRTPPVALAAVEPRSSCASRGRPTQMSSAPARLPWAAATPCRPATASPVARRWCCRSCPSAAAFDRPWQVATQSLERRPAPSARDVGCLQQYLPNPAGIVPSTDLYVSATPKASKVMPVGRGCRPSEAAANHQTRQHDGRRTRCGRNGCITDDAINSAFAVSDSLM